MKKRIFLSVLILIVIFTITGCGTNNNSSGKNSKEYNIDGISIKLDKEDSISGMKYKISKSLNRRGGASATIYNLYYDENGDKFAVSNIVFSLTITADIMQSKSYLEYDINKLNNNSSLKNITREKKEINGITWEYVSLDNYYETGTNNHFKNHSYYYETYDGKYYTTYTISFNKAENTADLENDFLNSIVFE